MVQSNIRSTQPIAYLISVPRSLSPEHIANANYQLQQAITDASRLQFVSYYEQPAKLLCDWSLINSREQRNREQNLQLLHQGDFGLVYICGGGVSEYVREIVRQTYLSETWFVDHIDGDSLLGQYRDMLDSYFQGLGFLSQERVG